MEMIQGRGPTPEGFSGAGAGFDSVMSGPKSTEGPFARRCGPITDSTPRQRVAERYERTLIHDPSAPTPSPTAKSSTEIVARNWLLTAVGIWNMLTIAGWIGSQTAVTTRTVTIAPIRPHRMPSRMNGQRMKLSDAPTRRMISISFERV